MCKTISGLLIVLFVSGCAAPGPRLDKAIERSVVISSSIRLGDDIDSTLPVLQSAHEGLLAKDLKPAEQYIKEGYQVYVFYLRTSRIPDGLTTDDEFTPYVFVDSKLASVGWTILGGPKTVGDPNRNRYSSSSSTQSAQKWGEIFENLSGGGGSQNKSTTTDCYRTLSGGMSCTTR